MFLIYPNQYNFTRSKKLHLDLLHPGKWNFANRFELLIDSNLQCDIA